MKQSVFWDHKYSLEFLISLHEVCLFEPEFHKHINISGALECGAIHLLSHEHVYTSLVLVEDGWKYYADTSIPNDIANNGNYILMPVKKAIKLAEASSISYRGVCINKKKD